MMDHETGGPFFSTDLIGADGRLRRLHKGRDNFLANAFRGGGDAGRGAREMNDRGPADRAAGRPEERREGVSGRDRVGAVIGSRDGRDAADVAALKPRKSLLAGSYDQPGTRGLL